jgi:hypothetical protein
MSVAQLTADVRSMAPAAYIAATGLRPEDSFGFLPVEQSDGSALVYVYRNRPEYAERRAGLAAPQRSRLLGGAVEVDRPGAIDVDIDPSMTGGVDVGQMIRDATGSAPPQALEAVKQAVDVDQLVGAATASVDPGEDRMVSHRVYPGLHKRSSGKQLGHFLPRYCETVGVRPEDVFGVFARGIHLSGGESSAREWQSFWLVYRDRPEYATGREQWAAEMHKGGGWPEPEFAPLAEPAPGLAPSGGQVKVKQNGWPRRKLVMRETPEGLAESVSEMVTKAGYEPEASFGLAADFQHRKIQLAWRS